MSVFYGIACLLSLILLVIYFFVDKKREKWLNQIVHGYSLMLFQ